MPDRIPLGRLAGEMKRRVRDGVAGAHVHEILVAQAHARMDDGGDSEHTYPDLWNHPGSIRAGGQPLKDNQGRGPGRPGLYSALSGETELIRDTIVATLTAPLYGIYHQHGFKTKGPNYIPLTLKGRRDHTPGRNPADEGLEPWDDETKTGDYLMAWGGVTVPQRKIFNLPPENREDILTTIRLGIKRRFSVTS